MYSFVFIDDAKGGTEIGEGTGIEDEHHVAFDGEKAALKDLANRLRRRGHLRQCCRFLGERPQRYR